MRRQMLIFIVAGVFLLLLCLRFIDTENTKYNTNIYAHSSLSLGQSVLVTPTATPASGSTNGGLDPAVLAALIGLVGVIIGALIVGAFGIYQMRRNARLLQEQAQEQLRIQHQQAQEILTSSTRPSGTISGKGA